MCIDPMTALGIATSAFGFIQESAGAATQSAQYQANAVNANQAAAEQYYENNNKLIQEEAKATQQRIANKTELIKAKGMATASTENNGQSTNMVLRDLERQAAKSDATVNVNLKNAKAQAKQEAQNIKLQAQGRIDSVPLPQEPDLISNALSGLGVVIGANEKYNGHGEGKGAKKP